MTPLDDKLRRIEALRSENEEDTHPSFVRIEATSRSIQDRYWETETLTIADPLGIDGIEAFVSYYGPSLGSTLIPFMVLFAFAVGWFLAYASQGGAS